MNQEPISQSNGSGRETESGASWHQRHRAKPLIRTTISRLSRRALKEAPRGAIAVAGAAVVLLMICWFAIYVFVFLPRGSVG